MQQNLLIHHLALHLDGTIGITGQLRLPLNLPVTLIMKFWFPDTPSLIWSGLCLAIIFLLNYLSVKGFGESEYWFALIKVVTIIIFLIVGFMMIFGIMGGETVGFKNFTVADAPFNGGIMAIIGVFMATGFSFQGTELLGVAAGETSDPERNIPKAIRSIFLFYSLQFSLSVY